MLANLIALSNGDGDGVRELIVRGSDWREKVVASDQVAALLSDRKGKRMVRGQHGSQHPRERSAGRPKTARVYYFVAVVPRRAQSM